MKKQEVKENHHSIEASILPADNIEAGSDLLNKRGEGLSSTREIIKSQNNTNILTRVPEILLDNSMSIMKARKGAIILLSSTGKSFRIIASKGLEIPDVKKSFLNNFQLLLPELLSEKRHIITTLKERLISEDQETDPTPSTAVFLPFFIKEKIVGLVFLAFMENRKCFNDREIDLLNILMGEIGFAIENNRLNRRLNKNIHALKSKTSELEEVNRSLENEIEIRRYIEEEKEKLQSQLHVAQKLEALGTLAGGIAHNFNNLLMGIQGNATLINLGLGDDNPITKRAQNIEKLVRSGSKLTTQLLGYARKGQLEMTPINLNYLIKDICETFANTKKEVMIHEDLADDLYRIMADANQIEQVLLNLFVNAADAMPNSGHLYISTQNCNPDDFKTKPYTPKPGTDYILLSVKDTGEGMDKDTMGKVFEPFFSTKEPGKGTGLGLASCYGIVKGHGGFIDVDSEPGKGSTFSIYLPASDKKNMDSENNTGTIKKGSGSILVIDDEELILEVSAMMVKELGYTVFESKNGKEAVEYFKKFKDEIDLVILDIVMPDLSGEEVFDLIKTIRPEIKILLTSGYTFNNRAKTLIGRGCSGFIKKPYSIEELSEKINRILTRH